MSGRSSSQRARHGAVEGAAIGLAVSLLRAGMTLYRKGLPDDPAAVVSELLAYVAVNVIVCGYVFAVGRAVADGFIGSLLGAAVVAVAASFGGSRVPFESSSTPYPILIGAVVGVLVGAPIGAFIQRGLARKPPSDGS